MKWFQNQYDKNLMSVLFIGSCGFAMATGNDKIQAFALQAAAGLLGCLLTLVTAKRNADPAIPDPSTTVLTQDTHVVTKSAPATVPAISVNPPVGTTPPVQ